MSLDAFISLLGILLILAVLNDFIRTTLRLEGAGWLSRVIMESTWRASLFFQHRLTRRRVLPDSGVVALLTNIFMWTALLWLGWLLFFLPHPGSVLSTEGGEPAGFWSTTYFVGYSLITLGNGDYSPNGPLFQIATVLTAITGFFLLTLSVTYLVPVVGAVLQSRQLAAQILLLGDTPYALARHLATQRVNQDYVHLLQGLPGPVALLSQNHFAYPVLKYFPSSQRRTSSAIALAVLDEALTLMLLAPEEGDGASGTRIAPIRNAVDDYLRTQIGPIVRRLPAAPPAPSLEPLREAGLATVSDQEFAGRLESIAERRSLLKVMLSHEDREWREIHDGKRQ